MTDKERIAELEADFKALSEGKYGTYLQCQARTRELERKLEEAVKALDLALEICDDLGWVEDDAQEEIPATVKALRKARASLSAPPAPEPTPGPGVADIVRIERQLAQADHSVQSNNMVKADFEAKRQAVIEAAPAVWDWLRGSPQNCSDSNIFMAFGKAVDALRAVELTLEALK